MTWKAIGALLLISMVLYAVDGLILGRPHLVDNAVASAVTTSGGVYSIPLLGDVISTFAPGARIFTEVLPVLFTWNYSFLNGEGMPSTVRTILTVVTVGGFGWGMFAFASQLFGGVLARR